MYIRIRCTKCRIRFDSIRELLEHVATHDAGRATGIDAATVARTTGASVQPRSPKRTTVAEEARS
jgi:hypothetical protein